MGEKGNIPMTRFRTLVASLITAGLLAAGTGSAGAQATAPLAETEKPTDITETAGSCPRTRQLVASFGSPMRSVQATFEVSATKPPSIGIDLHVDYIDSGGRPKGYVGYVGRPAKEVELPLPGDGRGLTNIVEVWAWMGGDPAGVSCNIKVTSQEAISPLEQQCFLNNGISGVPIAFNFGEPQGATEIRVEFESRLATAGIGFQTWMTNSVGSKSNTERGGFAPWQVHPPTTIVMPKDGRGYYNVTTAEVKMNMPNWWDVLKCIPSVTTRRALSKIESNCFAGQVVTLANPTGTNPVRGSVTLEQRPSGSSINYESSAYRSDGSVAGSWHGAVGGGYVGLPETVLRFPANGTPIEGVASWTMRVRATEWKTLLACSPSVGGVPQLPTG